jgi:hypothetical protein
MFVVFAEGVIHRVGFPAAAQHVLMFVVFAAQA